MVIVIIVALVVFGMVFGSFVNAWVWRLHAQMEIEEELAILQAKKAVQTYARKISSLQKELRALSMRSGRSMCSECRHPLAPKDLIPLMSWVLLRGKCRYCKQPIRDTPWLEVLLPAAFVASYVFWPLSFDGYGVVSFGFWLVFLVAFAALTLYDLRWYILPDRVVWPLVFLAVAQVVVYAVAYGGGFGAVVDAFWGVVMASGIFYVLYVVSKGEWIGGGDVKLGIVLGLLVGGPFDGLLVLFTASLLGTIVSLPQLVRRRITRKSAIPFGPCLMAATVIVVLFGGRFVEWFERFLLVG